MVGRIMGIVFFYEDFFSGTIGIRMIVGFDRFWNRLVVFVGILCLCWVFGACNVALDPVVESEEERSGLTTTSDDSLTTDMDDDCPEVMGGHIKVDASTDLDQFSCLQEVQGWLTFDGILTEDLHFLQNLERVEGVLSIDRAPKLRTLAGLENLREVTVQLALTSNPSLVDLSALGSLESWNFLFIQNNASLENIQSIQGDFFGVNAITANRKLYLSSLPRLRNLDGFSSVSKFRGKLIIEECGELQNIEGIRSMFAGPHMGPIETEISLQSLPKLESLHGLEMMTSVNGFSVDDCPSLRSMEGLNGLREAEWIKIEINESLESLDGLESLESVYRYLQIGQCTSHGALADSKLASIDALRNLRQVRYMSVSNTRLDSLDALDPSIDLQSIEFRHNLRLPLEDIYDFLESAGLLDPSGVQDNVCESLGQEGSCGSCALEGQEYFPKQSDLRFNAFE